MMSKNDDRKIIDSLANDETVEMKSDDLVQMLNIELSKPESEIDGQLVKEILDALEPSEPDPAQIKASWLNVKESLPKRQGRGGWPARLARIAATAAVIFIVLVSTIRDAGAFRWTLIQKFLKPVAETFGIVIDDQTNVLPEVTQSPVYSVSDAPSELVAYAMLDEVPDMHDGYVIRPKWIPDGFVFCAGSKYTSIDSAIYSLEFMRDEQWFSININVITDDSAVYSYDFERSLSIPVEKVIGSYPVTLYSNTDDKDQTAFWISENAYYMITGEIKQSELIDIIEGMIE